MNINRTYIRNLVESITPHDEREREDLSDVLDWIDDGSELFRREKPDVPHKHLVSYFVLVDHARWSMLLVDHIKAGLWLPTGGHVEPDENPRQAVLRELGEELGSKAALVATVADTPLFATVTTTRGAGSHVDVSLWYVVAGDVAMWLDPDPREFRGHRWWSLAEIKATDGATFDPELQRFVDKLEGSLAKRP